MSRVVLRCTDATTDAPSGVVQMCSFLSRRSLIRYLSRAGPPIQCSSLDEVWSRCWVSDQSPIEENKRGRARLESGGAPSHVSPCTVLSAVVEIETLLEDKCLSCKKNSPSLTSWLWNENDASWVLQLFFFFFWMLHGEIETELAHHCRSSAFLFSLSCLLFLSSRIWYWKVRSTMTYLGPSRVWSCVLCVCMNGARRLAGKGSKRRLRALEPQTKRGRLEPLKEINDLH